MDEKLAALSPFAISLALGFLVGVERQRHAGDHRFPAGGIRTFPLVAVLGCSAAWAGAELGTAAFAIVAGTFAALVVASYVVGALRGEHGLATALASVVTFVVGLMTFHKQPLLAAALTIATTGLLSLRAKLHDLAKKIEERDLFATLQLAALTLVVLPVLPDKEPGPPPFDVLNPFKVWLLVVLVATISFIGYVGTKVLGPGRGIAVAGALGGLASSTAVTLGFSTKSKETPALAPSFALGIATAWGLALGRILIEIAVVNADLLPRLVPVIGAGMVVAIVGAAILNRRTETPDVGLVAQRNPFSIVAALQVGAIFAVALLVARSAQMRFQAPGVLVAAAISGAVDMDAMTLSMARLSGAGEVAQVTAEQAILLTVTSNTLAKAGLATILGGRPLAKALLPVMGAMVAAGAGAYFLI